MSHLDAAKLFRVDGLVAVITGGGSGIGRTMTTVLAQNGAKKVYILGRRLEPLQETASIHPSIVPIQCDVTSKDALSAAASQIESEVGHINLLIANSGTLGPTAAVTPEMSIEDMQKALWSVPVEEVTDTYHVNVTSVIYTVTAFLALLDKGNRDPAFGAPGQGSRVPLVQSQVIVTSSVAGLMRGGSGLLPYATSKAAVLHLAKVLSTLFKGKGIRVNALSPGLFPSALATNLTAGRVPEDETPDHPRYMPANRFGTDEDMGGTILYLASRAGAYTNGAVILPDGGRVAVVPATY